MASRKRDLPTPPSTPDKPKPTAAPKSGYQWLYNMNLKKWEQVKIGSSAAQGPTYYQGTGSTTTTPTPSTTSMGQPGGREATPAERAAAIEYSRSRIEAVTTPERRGGSNTPPPPGQAIDWNAIVQQLEKDALLAAKELYGGFYGIIETNDEVKNLIVEAALNKWNETKFKAKLIETNWYKTTTDTARKFDVDEQLDPATIAKKINDQAAAIQNAALEKGARLSTASTQELARNAIRLGWTQLELSNAIGAEIFKTTPTTELARGYIGQSARTTAGNYGVRLSDQTLMSWTQSIMTGSESDQTFKDYLLNQAKILYPALSEGFDRGLTFGQMTDAYAEQAARLLEIPATQIDFMDPKWAAAFTSRDSTGKPSQMSYGEWTDYVKTNPAFGWEYTDNAKNTALDLVGRVARLFGAG